MKLYHYIDEDESVDFEDIQKLNHDDRYYLKIKVIAEYIDRTAKPKNNDLFVRINVEKNNITIGHFTGLHYAYFDRLNSNYGILESDVMLCKNPKEELIKIRNSNPEIYQEFHELYKKHII